MSSPSRTGNRRPVGSRAAALAAQLAAAALSQAQTQLTIQISEGRRIRVEEINKQTTATAAANGNTSRPITPTHHQSTAIDSPNGSINSFIAFTQLDEQQTRVEVRGNSSWQSVSFTIVSCLTLIFSFVCIFCFRSFVSHLSSPARILPLI